jgi:hypothetical protein
MSVQFSISGDYGQESAGVPLRQKKVNRPQHRSRRNRKDGWICLQCADRRRRREELVNFPGGTAEIGFCRCHGYAEGGAKSSVPGERLQVGRNFRRTVRSWTDKSSSRIAICDWREISSWSLMFFPWTTRRWARLRLSNAQSDFLWVTGIETPLSPGTDEGRVIGSRGTIVLSCEGTNLTRKADPKWRSDQYWWG